MDDIHPLVNDYSKTLQTIDSTIGVGISRADEAIEMSIENHEEPEEEDNQGLLDEQKLLPQVQPGFDTSLGVHANTCCTETSVDFSSESVEGAIAKRHPSNSTTNYPTNPIYRSKVPPPIPLDTPTQSRINKNSQTAITENPTIRIIVDIPPHLVDWLNPITSITTTINPFLSHWQTQNKVNLIAVEMRSRHAYAAIEINNHQYDFQTAHKQTFVFPVYVLKVARRSLRWRFYRAPAEDVRVMNEIKMVHYLHREEFGTPYLIFRVGGREPVFGESRKN